MAVITGSGEGLGEQVARVFRREGADVVLASSEGAATTGQGINAKERKAANA